MTEPKDSIPRCPKCGHLGTRTENKLYYCHTCEMAYDGEDDGIVGYGDPSRQAELAERREQQRQDWIARTMARKRR
jgi:ribosomal protein L37AE/L43A